jgi:photosystem II stability/assembly factor-like uncharacterized protein
MGASNPCSRPTALRSGQRVPRWLLVCLVVAPLPLAAGWQSLGPPGIDGTELAVARDGRTVWALSAAAGVFRSEDTGLTWTAASGGLTPGYVDNQELRADAADPRAAWLRRGAVAVLRTEDVGATWREVYRTASLLRFLGADPSGRGRAWIIDGWFTEPACARRTVDGGATWQRIACLSVDGAEPIGVGADGSLWWWVRGADHLLRLRPRGKLIAVRPPARQGAAELFSLDPDDAETLWHTTFGEPPQLAVSRDGGASFVTVCTHDCPSRRVILSPGRPQQLFATTFDRGGARVSRDGGATWRPVSGLTQGRVRTLAALPGATDVVLALPFHFFGPEPAGILRSPDGGHSWSEIRAGLYALPVHLLGIDLRDDRRWFAGLDDDPSALWVARRNGPWRQSDDWAAVGVALVGDEHDPALRFALTPRGLRRSDDGGVTWRSLPGPRAQREWTALAGDPRQRAALWAVADRRPLLWHSRDGGERFAAALAVPLVEVFALAVDPADPSRLVVHGAERLAGPCGDCTRPLSLEIELGGGAWRRNGEVVYDRRRPGTSWRVSPGGLLERRTEGSARFSRVALPDLEARSRQVVAGRWGTYVLAERSCRPSPPGACTQVVVWRTEDAGGTWRRLGGSLPTVLTIGRLEVVGQHDQLLLATTGGLYGWSRP